MSKKLLISLLGVCVVFAATFAAIEMFSAKDTEQKSDDSSDTVASAEKGVEGSESDVLGENDESESESNDETDEENDTKNSEDEEPIEVPEEQKGDLRYDPEEQKSFVDKLNEKNSQKGDE